MLISENILFRDFFLVSVFLQIVFYAVSFFRGTRHRKSFSSRFFPGRILLQLVNLPQRFFFGLIALSFFRIDISLNWFSRSMQMSGKEFGATKESPVQHKKFCQRYFDVAREFFTYLFCQVNVRISARKIYISRIILRSFWDNDGVILWYSWYFLAVFIYAGLFFIFFWGYSDIVICLSPK